MPRVILFATTTGYQVRVFGEAAERLGLDLVFATDRCQTLEDPWRDAAIPVRFHDETASLRRLVEAMNGRGVDGVLGVGDRPALLAALAAETFDLPARGVDGARASADKLRYRRRLAEVGLPSPAFRAIRLDQIDAGLAEPLGFPCVVKPLALSGSRGVIRADDQAEFDAALARVGRLLAQPGIRALRDPANDQVLVEEYVEGAEITVEGLLDDGRLHVMTIFDKPDPLDGPFFEETIYATPTSLAPDVCTAIEEALAGTVRALGLTHGPVHAECRLGPGGVVVLEVAARPIGGLCARVLRCVGPSGRACSYEEVLLRHATGEAGRGFRRAPGASAVMMIPTPRAGHLRRVRGQDRARAVRGVDDLVITAKPGQRLVPMPEGASYLGFIFASAATPEAAVAAVRRAHSHLSFDIDLDLPMAR
ncbi:MAG: ATP-grasp domain-containing protein [Vicinamibacterales bacterium]|jgi:biotin carboxylase|nr:ATP-grasp domain-containing protein [Vicinamibacterales bacterium]MDP7470936.1 ATP-grasp domain-containing protein [Vicinamibacterales bacterium]MDP7673059.1 ATP-grasp domain-containing protein [Vicinamibacterales bacterium]HJO38613.1 ATP-grasp domain-containing protein [Vicinamibacterales bacterium]